MIQSVRGTRKLSRLLATTALAAASLVAMGTSAKADPVDALETPAGEQVVGGAATFDRPDPGVLNINQSTDRVVIDWQSFNIGEKAKTEFFQPSSSALAVNRVVGKGEDPAQILGTLKANGKVMVLDKNGVLFGKNAVIDVNSIVASTGDVDTQSVMNGDTKIELKNFGNGAVVNEGTINASDAGLVALVAPTVKNAGVINARVGKVALAAGGERATVDLYGDGLVEIAVDGNKSKALIENTGTINAEGGTVLMTASAANDVVDDVINTKGIVSASSATMQGGKIILKGGNAGKVKVSGLVDASGKNGGGSVEVTGHDVETTQDSVVLANAWDNGNGGTVIMKGDNNGLFNGYVFATGGAESGNGGFVEVSSGNLFGFGGLVDTTAANGNGGSLLIDPLFTIIHTGILDDTYLLGYAMSDKVLAKNLSLNSTVTVQANKFIDVGTDLDVKVLGQTLIGNGDIDVSHYDYNTLEFTGFNKFHIPQFKTVNHKGTTDGNLVLDSKIVNFNKDLTMGTGNVLVKADTVNLDATVSGLNGGSVELLGYTRLSGLANTVNVLSDSAKIQQGLDVIDHKLGGLVNVAAGTYDEDLTMRTANVILNGAQSGVHGNDASRGTGETKITPHSPGIVVTADNTTVDGVTIDGASDGIVVDHAKGVTLKNNVITNSSDRAIYMDTSNDGTVIDNRIDVAKIGIATKNSSNLILGVQVANPNIFSNVITKADNGIAVNGGTKISLNKNLIYKTLNTGILISGVDGTNSTNGAILNRNRVMNGQTGIKILSSDFANLGHNIVEGASGDGVFVNGSDNVFLRYNRSAKNGGDGFRLILSDDATITNNTAWGLGGDGFDLSSSDGAIISDNFVGSDVDGVSKGAANIKGDGIKLLNSNGAVIVKNTVQDVVKTGINAKDSSDLNIGAAVADPDVFSNKISNAKVGISVNGGTNIDLRKNLISKIATDGIVVQNVDGADESNGAVLNGNQVTQSLTGIRILGSDFANLGYNVTEDLTGDGIFVKDSDNTFLRYNRTNNLDGTGINLQNADAAFVAFNHAYDTGIDGLLAKDSDDAIIQGNLFYNNGKDGIEVVDSDNSLIDGNTIFNTAKNGIEVDGGTNTTITGNIVALAGFDGISVTRVDLDGSVTTPVDISGNQVFLTQRHGIFTNNTGAVSITDNEVALTGTNFLNWSFGKSENEDEGGNTEFPTFTPDFLEKLVLVDESGTTLNWGNGDGIHVENAHAYTQGEKETDDGDDENTDPRPGFFPLKIGPSVFATDEAGSQAVLISGNKVKYTGGDGIEVYDSGATTVSDNIVNITGINSTSIDTVLSLDNTLADAVKGLFFNANFTPKFGEGALISFIDGLVPDNVQYGWGTGDGIRVWETGLFNNDEFTGFENLSDEDYGVKITGNTVDTTGGDGIDVYYGDWSLISGNTVSNAGQSVLNGYTDVGPTFDKDDSEDEHTYGDGIVVDNGTVQLPPDEGDDEDEGDFEGLSLTNITGNTVTDSANNNIEVLDVNRSRIDGNTTSFTSGFGGGANNIVVAANAEPQQDDEDTGEGDDNEGGDDQFFPEFFPLVLEQNFGYETIISNNLTVDNAPQNGVLVSGQDSATIASNIITNSGVNGLFVKGPDNGSVILTGNTFTDNTVGASFESGEIDLTGATNTFNNGETALQFLPFNLGEGGFASMNLVGDTIGTSVFNGQSQFYVQLGNGAFFAPGTPTLLDGLNATYDGLNPASTGGFLSQSDYDAVEAKIFHYIDDQTLGLFFFGIAVPDATFLTTFGEEDVFNKFAGFNVPGNGLNLTITGLPGGPLPTTNPQPLNLANIEPAAGGDNNGPTNPADIEPAAGGGNSSSCLGTALAGLDSGNAATYSYSGNVSQNLSAIATCDNDL